MQRLLCDRKRVASVEERVFRTLLARQQTGALVSDLRDEAIVTAIALAEQAEFARLYGVEASGDAG